DAPRHYQTKAKNAQEAHEAIRPTDLGHLPDAAARGLDSEQALLYDLIWKRRGGPEALRPTDLGHLPDEAARGLESEQARLYDLIWKRMAASQMQSAELERTTVDIDAGGSAHPVALPAPRPGGALRRVPRRLPGGPRRGADPQARPRGRRGPPAADEGRRPADRARHRGRPALPRATPP